MEIYSGNINLLERALNYSSLKQRAIANNIANANTPNYKSMEVSFKDVLEKSSSTNLHAHKSDPRHYDFPHSQKPIAVYKNGHMEYHHNGNNVDLEREMSNLATNQIYYNAMIDRINGKFSTLQTVIKGGR